MKIRDGYHATEGDRIRVTDAGSRFLRRKGWVIHPHELTPGVLVVHFDGDPPGQTEEVRRWQVVVEG